MRSDEVAVTVSPPAAVSASPTANASAPVDAPWLTAWFPTSDTVGAPLTVTVKVSVAVSPPASVTVSVMVAVPGGEAGTGLLVTHGDDLLADLASTCSCQVEMREIA